MEVHACSLYPISPQHQSILWLFATACCELLPVYIPYSAILSLSWASDVLARSFSSSIPPSRLSIPPSAPPCYPSFLFAKLCLDSNLNPPARSSIQVSLILALSIFWVVKPAATHPPTQFRFRSWPSSTDSRDIYDTQGASNWELLDHPGSQCIIALQRARMLVALCSSAETSWFARVPPQWPRLNLRGDVDALPVETA